MPAPVGFQCPSCVAAARQRVPPVRSPFGGSLRGRELRMTKGLVGVNVVVFLVTMLARTQAFATWGIIGFAVAAGEWYRLLTGTFLHAGLWHVALNMLALWVLGSTLEPLLGRSRFLALYLVSALGGAVASYTFNPPNTVSVGASGAVFGLLGAILVVLRRLDRDTSGVMVILLLNVAFGFAVPSIDWRAHLGGLVVGAVQALAFAYAPAKQRTLIGWGTTVLLVVLLAAAVNARTDALLGVFGL